MCINEYMLSIWLVKNHAGSIDSLFLFDHGGNWLLIICFNSLYKGVYSSNKRINLWVYDEGFYFPRKIIIILFMAYLDDVG